MAPRAVANQLAAETPFDNFSFEPIREHQVLAQRLHILLRGCHTALQYTARERICEARWKVVEGKKVETSVNYT